MKYGIYLPNFGAYGSARALAYLARDAEEAGWDGFILWDHIARHGIVTDMVDEALDGLVGLWSGESFEFSGRHYTIRDSQFLPRPVQSPRIPIWVGGFWPNKRPFRRAAPWDGAFPLFAKDADRLSEFKEVVAFIRRHRIDSGSYDLAITGFTPGDKPAEAAEIVAPFASAGAIWWLELIVPNRFSAGYDEPWPVDQMRQRVLQGPPAVTA